MYILGISAFYHDSAAVLLKDGVIVAAAQEERFTRKKHTADFPGNAIDFILKQGRVSIKELDVIAFYDNPVLKLKRIIKTILNEAPYGYKNFIHTFQNVKNKLFLRKILCKKLKLDDDSKIIFSTHHLSHAACAFFPSPFKDAAILTMDGVGEWQTTTLGVGKGNDISFIKGMNFPHSLGLLYSSFTQFCGFKVNSGEYKLMGLAPYGNPNSNQVQQFIQLIYNELIYVSEDGSYKLNMKYFNYTRGLSMCDFAMWSKLFKIKPRSTESEISQNHMNLALACQIVTQDIVLKLAKHLKKLQRIIIWLWLAE